MSTGGQISREYHCGKKHWLDKSFLQVLKCLKVTGWLAKRKLILSDHMTRNPRPEPILCCRNAAGSHHPLGTLFLITRRLSPSCLAPKASPGFSCLTVEARRVCGGSKNNLSTWVQQTHFPLGPTAWLLSTSTSTGFLWELLWFLGRGTPAAPLGEEQVWRGNHQLWAHTVSKLFSPEFWRYLVENSKNSYLTRVRNFP